MSDTPAWMQQRECGSLFWLRVMCACSLRLGRRLTRPVVYLIAAYFLLAKPTARRASRNYLARVLARRPGWTDLYRHIFSFAATIHDRVFLLNDRVGAFRFESHGRELLDACQAGQDGALLFGAHFGSFEVMRTLARSEVPYRVSLTMYPDNARQINATLAAINPAVVADIIPLGRLDAMLAVSERLDAGGMVGILADRASGHDRYLQIPFLGSPAPFPTGPFRMAAMLRRPVFFIAGVYMGGNRYAIHFEPIADFSQTPPDQRNAAISEAMHNYAATLERHCRAAPCNWFNFFDFWNPAHGDQA